MFAHWLISPPSPTAPSKTKVFIERVPGASLEIVKEGKKTTSGDNAVGSFIWPAVGHRNPHTWGKSRNNASGRVRSSSWDEELCVATLRSRSQTEECHHDLRCSQQPGMRWSASEKRNLSSSNHLFRCRLKTSSYCVNDCSLVFSLHLIKRSANLNSVKWIICKSFSRSGSLYWLDLQQNLVVLLNLIIPITVEIAYICKEFLFKTQNGLFKHIKLLFIPVPSM